MHDCIFCKIVKGEIPSKKVYEDGDVLVFLDINPASKGHVLVTAKKHYENIYDVDEEILKKMIVVSKKMADKIKKAFDADGINIVQNNGQHAGQLVNHIHFHVIPRYPEDKVIITYQRQQMSEHQMNEIVNILKEEAVKHVKEKEERDFAPKRFHHDDEEWEL
jgi:histidine triad (HIT) family protein